MLNATAGAMVMLSCAVALAGGELESVTRTVKLEIPPPEGVPVIAPVLPLENNPRGKLPAVMLQVYGVSPPVAASIAP